MRGRGRAFSWIVLVAILGFGLVALGLLTAGQFVRIGALALGLALGTVLIGSRGPRAPPVSGWARASARL